MLLFRIDSFSCFSIRFCCYRSTNYLIFLCLLRRIAEALLRLSENIDSLSRSSPPDGDMTSGGFFFFGGSSMIG